MCFRIALSTTSKRRKLLWALSIAFECLQEGGIEIFGFAVLAIFYLNFSIFLDRLFGFPAKRHRFFGFGVHSIIAFCGFFVF